MSCARSAVFAFIVWDGSENMFPNEQTVYIDTLENQKEATDNSFQWRSDDWDCLDGTLYHRQTQLGCVGRVATPGLSGSARRFRSFSAYRDQICSVYIPEPL